MNDTETNPQRHGASSPEEPSHRSADASRDPMPERDESDTTAQLRGEATADQPPAAPAHPYAPPTPEGPAAPAPDAPGGHGGYGAPAAPASGAPAYGRPGGWQPPAPQHGWQQQAPHGAPYPYAQQQAPYGAPQQPWQAGQFGGRPGDAPQGTEPPLPPWATNVGQQPPGRPGRGRTILAAGAAAVVLALGAGGVGAWAALALQDDTGGTATVSNSNTTASRTVNTQSFAQIAEQVQPAVVSISTGNGEGSGVVLTADGFILSNNHVVASARGETVQVAFSDGRTATARIVGTDPRTDLAVVKAEGVSGLKFAAFGKSADMKVGDSVLALGSPLGLEGSVTYGIISAKDRTIRSSEEGQPSNPFGQEQGQQSVTSISGLLQTDAAINPGNSGGALVNTNGEVVGINTAIATSGQSTGNIGVGFAIPSDKASAVANALMKGEKVSHPYLGVSLTESAGVTGAVVGSVTANGPAAKAGLREGDVITKVGDKVVGDSDDVISAVQSGTVGQQVTVTYTRNGQEATAQATLAEAP
ncbi:trypsin-like peptidase domain-containing protein [Spirilliplanes yamanashiensis]|nr:trypsin-like peptidase domain-containing protein [Spirilliplanes yamanashiensis]MDP9820081.1 putative serine protease PepD [Spirilliplanes yamanashiensis]